MEIIHGHNPSNSASIACGRPGGCVLTAMETDINSVEGCNSLHCATRSGFFLFPCLFAKKYGRSTKTNKLLVGNNPNGLEYEAGRGTDEWPCVG